jgi:esterase/lipase superfamily enzyme
MGETMWRLAIFIASGALALLLPVGLALAGKLSWLTTSVLIVGPILAGLSSYFLKDRSTSVEMRIPDGRDRIIFSSKDANIEIILKEVLSKSVLSESADVPDGVKAVRKVMFATTRQINESQDDVKLDLEKVVHHWRTSLRYGRAWVSIPEAHKVGVVERPKPDWKFLWLKKQPEDIAEHFTLLELWKLSKDAFYQEMRSADRTSALLFVHGFNVPFIEAIYRSAQIAFDTNFSGHVICFSWPSAGSIPMYDYDREKAFASGPGLRQLLRELKTEAKIDNIFLVAHSLGSQVVVHALEQAADIKLPEIVFGAPDVDRDVFLSRAELIRDAAGGLTIYASAADKALMVSKLKAGGVPRVGDVPAEGPLLIPGFDTIDVTAVGEDMFALNHGTLSRNRSVLDDLGRIIIHRDRPPHERTPTLQRVRLQRTLMLQWQTKESPEEYWKFPY